MPSPEFSSAIMRQRLRLLTMAVLLPGLAFGTTAHAQLMTIDEEPAKQVPRRHQVRQEVNPRLPVVVAHRGNPTGSFRRHKHWKSALTAPCSCRGSGPASQPHSRRPHGRSPFEFNRGRLMETYCWISDWDQWLNFFQTNQIY